MMAHLPPPGTDLVCLPTQATQRMQFQDGPMLQADPRLDFGGMPTRDDDTTSGGMLAATHGSFWDILGGGSGPQVKDSRR